MLPSSVAYTSDIRDISHIEFCLLSSDEVRRRAVVTVTSSRLVQPVQLASSSGGSNQLVSASALANTLYDPRFGTIEKLTKCATCKLSEKSCPGHTGVIELPEPIFHPTLLTTDVLRLMRTLCFVCRHILIDESWVRMNRLDLMQGSRRYGQISVMLKANPILCRRCSTPQLDFRVEEYRVFAYAHEKRFRVTVDRKPRAPRAGSKAALAAASLPVLPTVAESSAAALGNVIKQEISARSVLELLQRDGLCDEWLKLTGCPTPPRNYIMEVVEVPPVCVRPYLVMQSGLGHDDLTFKYSEIVKVSDKILRLQQSHGAAELLPSAARDTAASPAQDWAFYRDQLRDLSAQLSGQVRTLFHNKNKQSKNPHTGNPTKDIQKRVDGKQGRVRGNLNGKRTNFNARSPISPDPNVDADVVVIPEHIARVQTFPLTVTLDNLELCKGLMRRGKVNQVHRRSKAASVEAQEKNPLPCAPMVFDIQAFRKTRFVRVDPQFQLQEGDVVHSQKGALVMSSAEAAAAYCLAPNERVSRDGALVRLQDVQPTREERAAWDAKEPGAPFLSSRLGTYVRKEPPRDFALQVGDTVERQYETGMSVYFNRQPTLHIGSMIERKALVLPGNKDLTLKFNLAGCDSFNADMDGDEMTVWIPVLRIVPNLSARCHPSSPLLIVLSVRSSGV